MLPFESCQNLILSFRQRIEAMGALYCIFCFVLLFCVNRLESAYDESHRYDQTHQYNYDPYQTGYDQRQEELNSLRENTCSRFDDQRDEFIIDIKTSVARGAKMIEAVKAHSLIECANLCCDNLSCDLGVFRVSSDLVHTEHNCYLITCGNAANCVMAYHREFIAVMFTSVQGELCVMNKCVQSDKTEFFESGQT